MFIRTWVYVFTLGLTLAPSFGVSKEDVQSAEGAADSATSEQAQQSSPDFIPALESIESAIRDPRPYT